MTFTACLLVHLIWFEGVEQLQTANLVSSNDEAVSIWLLLCRFEVNLDSLVLLLFAGFRIIERRVGQQHKLFTLFLSGTK